MRKLPLQLVDLFRRPRLVDTLTRTFEAQRDEAREQAKEVRGRSPIVETFYPPRREPLGGEQ